MKRTLVLGFCAFIAGGAAEVTSQSSQAPNVRFDVASIRPTPLPAQYSFTIQPTRLMATAATLEGLIARAYGVPRWRLVDAPRWVGDEHFTIQATSAEPVAPDQMMAMLRTLIEERFRLRVEFESRDGDVDLLLPAARDGARGPGLAAVDVDCATNRLMPGSGPGLFPPGTRIPCGQVRFRPAADGRPTSQTFAAVTLEGLADFISGVRNRPTLDRTGLAAQFDIQLDYVPDTLRADRAAGPSLAEALEEQLGLRLERGRGRVEFLVIRSVERARVEEN